MFLQEFPCRIISELCLQADVEEEITAEGTLMALHEDRHVASRYLHFLWTAPHSRYSLHFAGKPATMESGEHMRLKGLRVKRALALSGTTSVTSLVLALPNTFGAQHTIMILVNFRDNPYTPSDALMVLNTTSGFDMENSYQQTWLAADVVSWYTIQMDSTVCDYYSLASNAQAAATAAGVNLSNYTRQVYAFSWNAWHWWGIGTVGGNPSQAWINGSLQLKALGHEMLGLWHSHALQCSGTTIGTNCSSIEYGDTGDIMGIPAAGHLNAYNYKRNGWAG